MARTPLMNLDLNITRGSALTRLRNYAIGSVTYLAAILLFRNQPWGLAVGVQISVLWILIVGAIQSWGVGLSTVRSLSVSRSAQICGALAAVGIHLAVWSAFFYYNMLLSLPW